MTQFCPDKLVPYIRPASLKSSVRYHPLCQKPVVGIPLVCQVVEGFLDIVISIGDYDGGALVGLIKAFESTLHGQRTQTPYIRLCVSCTSKFIPNGCWVASQRIHRVSSL